MTKVFTQPDSEFCRSLEGEGYIPQEKCYGEVQCINI